MHAKHLFFRRIKYCLMTREYNLNELRHNSTSYVYILAVT